MPTQIASDDFNRADSGTLGANWTGSVPQSSVGITSNQAAQKADVDDNVVYWSANAFEDDHYSQATMSTTANPGFMGVVVRCNGTDNVIGQHNAFQGDLIIYWYNSAAYTQIGSTYTTSGWSNGDVAYMEANGTTFTLKQNGTSRVMGINSSAPSSGSPGIVLAANNERIDTWSGGNLSATDTPNYDNTTIASDSADPSSLTFSHTTTTESNRELVVFTSTESDTGGHTAQTVSGITYGGVALTKIRADYITDNGTEAWHLIAPATGANNVIVTMTGTVDGLFAAAITYYNVDQSSPIDNNAGTTTSSTSISQSLTTNNANAAILNIIQHYNSAVVLTPDANQTIRFNTSTTGDFTSAGGTRLVTSATSYTTSWTSDINDGMTLTIVSLKPYVAPVASTGSTFLMMGV